MSSIQFIKSQKWHTANTPAGKWKIVDQNGFSIFTGTGYGDKHKIYADVASLSPDMLYILERFIGSDLEDFDNLRLEAINLLKQLNQ